MKKFQFSIYPLSPLTTLLTCIRCIDALPLAIKITVFYYEAAKSPDIWRQAHEHFIDIDQIPFTV